MPKLKRRRTTVKLKKRPKSKRLDFKGKTRFA